MEKLIRKKVISILLTVSILCILLTPLNLFTMAEETAIQSFIDDSINLINRTPDNNIVLNSGETTETNSEFETCRLIVKSGKKPEKLNSIGMASGFRDYHIIQFENEHDAEFAFNYYTEQEGIIAVYPDEIISLSEFEINETALRKTTQRYDRLDSWGAETTGLYDLKDYICENSIETEEVVVAVVDSGVDLEHEFLRDRLIETGFNSSGVGVPDSEIETVDEHGTMVAGTIADSTSDDVKITAYKVLDSQGYGSVVSISVGLLAASENEAVDIINASIGIDRLGEENDIVFDVVEEAYLQGKTVVAAAGNEYSNISRFVMAPADSPFCITVSSNDICNYPSWFTNYGLNVDISAPGEDISVIGPNDTYGLASGTSFSAPYVTAACAMVKSIYPNYNNDDIKDAILGSAVPYSEHIETIDLYGVGILDAVGASVLFRQENVLSSVNPGIYDDEVIIDLSSKNSTEIYYTIDGTVPTKSNGLLYERPIQIEDDAVAVNAVAYSDTYLPSRLFNGIYYSFSEGTDEDFTIDLTGKLLSYSGNATNLKIPETINGITVADLSNGIFDNSQVTNVLLPDTIIVLTGGFKNNKTINGVWGNGVKEIGKQAFRYSSIYKVEFLNLEKICYYAFGNTEYLSCVRFPKAKEIEWHAFNSSKLLYAYLPQVESLGYKAFYNCWNLSSICIDNLKTITQITFSRSNIFSETDIIKPLDLPFIEDIGKKAFEGDVFCPARVEFSNLKILNSLPTANNKCLEIILVLPATVEAFAVDKDDVLSGHYKIFGTEGTKAEQWANENGFKFIEITPETGVITDLPEYYKSYMGELEADVVGFNRHYQWYANSIDSNEGGTPIEGAINKTFNPSNYPAPYYYCVVTSTDKGFDPVVIKTSACENRAAVADYSKVNEALAKVPTDLSKYTAESRSNLENAINAVDKNFSISEQAKVDAMAKAIEEAVVALELIPIDVFMVEAVIQMTCGESRKLTVVCDEKVTFESSDTSVATVDENGVVTAVGKGTATITAASSNKTDTCIVEVKYTVCQLVIHWFKLIIDFIVNCIFAIG
ncbi:MAG: S8 family serine peptidase [Clostridia bacterium]|nr:S8 family serine peptidase [Clostridia bacterium]